MKMRPFTFSLIFLLFLASQTVVDSFQNCNETPLCKRARSRKPGSCNLIAHDVSISVDGDLTAKLIPKGREAEDEGGQINYKPLTLRLSVNQVGIMRLKIKMDEDPASSLKKGFQVADEDIPWLKRFEARKVRLEKAWTEEEVVEGDGGRRILSSVVNLSDGYEGVLRHDPFEVYVREKAAGNKGRVVSFNSHRLFDFEQVTESISFDVSFYGTNSAYGITERNVLFVKPTKGPGVEEESQPYRWFNLDVFEYSNSPPPSGFYAHGFYGLSPFMAAHGNNRTSGFLWLNAAEMQIDVLGNNGWDAAAEDGIRLDTVWMSDEAGSVDTLFLVGPEPKDVVRQYTVGRGRPAQTLLIVLAVEKYWLFLLLLMILLSILLLCWVDKLANSKTENDPKGKFKEKQGMIGATN